MYRKISKPNLSVSKKYGSIKNIYAQFLTNKIQNSYQNLIHHIYVEIREMFFTNILRDIYEKIFELSNKRTGAPYSPI